MLQTPDNTFDKQKKLYQWTSKWELILQAGTRGVKVDLSPSHGYKTIAPSHTQSSIGHCGQIDLPKWSVLGHKGQPALHTPTLLSKSQALLFSCPNKGNKNRGTYHLLLECRKCCCVVHGWYASVIPKLLHLDQRLTLWQYFPKLTISIICLLGYYYVSLLASR